MANPNITADPHPSLRFAAFVTEFPAPLREMDCKDRLLAYLRPDAATPLESDDAVRTAVRDMLRHGGYKPTGRGKPASEYLVRAANEGTLASINVAVDACNAVSLHSGLPISLLDLERAVPPFRIAIGQPGERYGFNRSGQEIDLEGLLCLYDAEGPCANAVKDSERTKTHAETRWTLSVIWAAAGLEDRLARALRWYRNVLDDSEAFPEY